MIKVIAFDYAGVIIPGPMSQWVKNNLSKEDENWKLYKESAHKWDRGEMTLDEVYKVLSKITGIPADQIWEKFYLKADLNRDVIKIIKKLKRNYKIFLFSNFISELIRKLLSNHNITDCFDEIIISSEHKMKKPDVEFFNLLLRISNVKKNEILLIDDRKDNIDAAKAFGITTILFTNTKNLEDDLGKMGLSF